MYNYIYICMYIYIYIYIGGARRAGGARSASLSRPHMHICMETSYTCMYCIIKIITIVYICIYIYICIHTYSIMYVYVYIYIYIHRERNIYIYIYTCIIPSVSEAALPSILPTKALSLPPLPAPIPSSKEGLQRGGTKNSMSY